MLKSNPEDVTCGFIKLKKELVPGKPLVRHAAYHWLADIGHPRVTQHALYASFGHSAIRDNDHARELLTRAAGLRAKVTRLDFCIDYCAPFAFREYYELSKSTKRNAPTILESPTGKTVYRGKRSSARMLRIYDKRGEILAKGGQDIGFELTRLELEVKRGMVERYRTLFMSGALHTILGDIQALYDLKGFCDTHQSSRPFDVPDKDSNPMAFVRRYKRIIRLAYQQDKREFIMLIKGGKK